MEGLTEAPLALDADDALLTRVRATLDWLWSELPDIYRRLFAPGVRRLRLPAPPPSVRAPLVESGLVAEVPGDDGAPAIVGLRRIRVLDGGGLRPRHSVLELGLGLKYEYHQDLWPETDALVAAVAALDGAGRRVCDLGTGSGVVAIEAAARGQAVLATDLYETALALARWNARLNGVADRIAFSEGHLWEAVPDGERFDLVVTNPHYGGPADQLRVEALLGAAAHVDDAGRLVLTTQLEWEGGRRAPRLGIVPVLERAAEAGLDLEVAPIPVDETDAHRVWFALVEGPQSLGSLVSRARFGIVGRRARGARGAVRVVWPTRWEALGPIRDVVPLGRVRRSGVHAGLGGDEDLAALAALLMSLDGNSLRPSHVPASLLDACRVGARGCVGRGGAARAVLSREDRAMGSVRPCTRGARIGDAVGDTEASLAARLEALAAEAEARRGCATCPARAACSRCLFPAIVDEATYCDFVRTHAARLPRLHRLLDAVEQLDERGVAAGRISVEIWPVADAGAEPVWAIERAGRAFLQRGPAPPDGARPIPAGLVEVTPLGASVATALARGLTSREALAARGWAAHPPSAVEAALESALAAIA